MKKGISPKYAGLLMCFFIAIAMSCVMAFAMTLIHADLNTAFLSSWLFSWGAGFLIGFPVALIVVPVVKKFVEFITEANKSLPVKVSQK